MPSKNQSGSIRPGHTVDNAGTPDHEIIDDVLLDFNGGFDRAPVNSHGTYLEGINEGLERLEEYEEGGFHPVHLGDTLDAAGRYRVIHKLGHGGFGTVWLCRDMQDPGYVAVKVMAGDVNPETLPDLALEKLDRSTPGAEYIAIPLDSFSIAGPNGLHQCIVLPVLGPCVSPRLWLSLKEEPGYILRSMARQATLAMSCLHKYGLCHGDFRPSNILVKLAKLNQLPEDKLLALLGQPDKAHVRTVSGEDPPASSPRYLTIPADISRLGDEYLTDRICVIDFGESFPISAPPESIGIPENYLPPEVLLEQDNAIGLGSDLWALGCTLFEIREQLPLFYMIFDKDELLAEMVRFFGKPPQAWWEKWEARKDFFDDKGTYIRDGEDREEWSLEVALSKPIQIFDPDEGQDGSATESLTTPKVEQELIADLLYRLFRYEAEERLSAEEVLMHEWFKM
ncbi:hypothetical protein N0V82_008987 [Gnomoniopsis sp. IMI 355080]|nr:hypothetical protein N0V82_008987 [Gnomoniopsis sp. IMI 355080]